MPFVATTSVRRLVLLLLGSAASVAIGVFMVRSPRQGESDVMWGWFVIVFFGLCAVVALVQLVGERDRLTIDSHGITWSRRSNLTIPWSAMTEVDLLTVSRGGHFLRLWLVDPGAFPPAQRPKRPGPSLSTRIYGGDVFIQLTPLDRSAKDVMRAVGEHRPPRDR